MKEMLYEVRCLKSNEDMIFALAGQFKQLSQSFDWLHFKFKFQIQIFKFKTNFCVCQFLLQNVFLKLINVFVFFVSFSLTLSLVP